MGRSQIVEKLNDFLNKGHINSEPGAVYLIVELRKILDHAYDKNTGYPLLRFYCDWVVHTKKSQNLQHIAPIVRKVYDDVKTQIEQSSFPLPGKSEVVGFIYMDALKMEMEDLFKKESLPLSLFVKKDWISFIGSLVQVLTDQPILNPIPEVPCLVLVPANPGCICGIMEFSQPIIAYDGKSYDHFNFKNAY